MAHMLFVFSHSGFHVKLGYVHMFPMWSAIENGKVRARDGSQMILKAERYFWNFTCTSE